MLIDQRPAISDSADRVRGYIRRGRADPTNHVAFTMQRQSAGLRAWPAATCLLHGGCKREPEHNQYIREHASTLVGKSL